MQAFRSRVAMLSVLFAVSEPAGADCLNDDDTAAFFNQLTGAWHGEAVTTPVGPRPYNITFERREADWIYGQADPGAALHHWGFYCENGDLWLRFLSTFRGNRDPILLKATTISADETHFKANDPAFLDVRIRPESKHSEFEVLHYGERHVLIKLKRALQN
jgi:hypothetical protein